MDSEARTMTALEWCEEMAGISAQDEETGDACEWEYWASLFVRGDGTDWPEPDVAAMIYVVQSDGSRDVTTFANADKARAIFTQMEDDYGMYQDGADE